MSKRRRKRPPSRKRRDEPQVFHLVDYEITYDPLTDPKQDRLPAEVQDQIHRLHSLCQSQPREALPELLDLIERHPEIEVFYNYLTVTYIGLGQFEKAQETNEECLRRHPDYLFGRLNYAEFCYQAGQFDKIPEILDHKFDLKLLYPKRNRFHISEYVAFASLVGRYFAVKGQIEVAEHYEQTLLELDPDHPMTARLQSTLGHARFLQRLSQIRQRFTNPFRKHHQPDQGRDSR